MLDIIAEIDALIAAGPHGRREAEIRIAGAGLPLDERLWLLRAVWAAQAARRGCAIKHASTRSA